MDSLYQWSVSKGHVTMNNTTDTKYEREQMQTEMVDEQITKSHVHKTYPVSDETIYAFMCDCGAAFDEEGNQLN